MLALLAALASCGLTACDGTSGVGHSESGGLCTHARQVSRLVVRRVSPDPAVHSHFTFPARVTVASPAKARPVAVALCALPYMPSGPMSCGSGTFGGWYTLRFAARGRALPAVRVDSDCEKVTGLGRARWAARTPSFWRVLGAAIGVPHAQASTFLP